MTRHASSSSDSRKSLRTLIIFCSVVFAIITISLTYKAISVMKTSSFDGDNLFVISFTKGNKADIVGFYPSEKKLTHLSVSNVPNPNNLEDSLGVFLDGNITLSKEFTEAKQAASFMQDAALFKKSATSNLSLLDLVRLSLFTRTLPPGNIQSEEIRLPLDDARTDEMIRELFSDQKLLKENLTIQIINGTGISGLGKKVERLLANRSASVISVINADSEQKTSRIEYSGEKSYTVEEMRKFLSVEPVQSENKNIADIILVIGIDRADSFK